MEENRKERWTRVGAPEDPEEIQRAVDEIDQEAFLRAEESVEVSEAEEEMRRKCEKIVGEGA